MSAQIIIFPTRMPAPIVATADPHGLVAACRALAASLNAVRERTEALAGSTMVMCAQADQVAAKAAAVRVSVEQLRSLTAPR